MSQMIVGNQPVIECLEEALRFAREHDSRNVVVSLTGYSEQYNILRNGEMCIDKFQLQALKQAVKVVEAEIANGEYPPSDPELDASHAVYNVVTAPIAFDFLVWLVTMEMGRISIGAPGPLKVGFFLGQDPARVMGEGNRMNWLEHVFRPALGLIGAVETECALGQHNDCYTMRPIVQASRNGARVPRFSTPHASLIDPGCITITLRETKIWPHRNSDIPAWLRFAHDLRRKGENVIFIRDTAKAMEPLGDFETDPLASVSLEMRMARYQTAKANLFVSNGPATLGVFSDRPWLQFIPVEPAGSGYRSNTAEFWKGAHGLDPDCREQYPWSSEAQRIVWEKDTYRSISKAWEQIAPLLDRREDPARDWTLGSLMAANMAVAR